MGLPFIKMEFTPPFWGLRHIVKSIPRTIIAYLTGSDEPYALQSSFQGRFGSVKIDIFSLTLLG